MDPYIEMNTCVLCESPASKAYVLFDLNAEQTLLRCSECGLIYNDRCRVDLENIYGNDYYEASEKTYTGGYFSYSQMENATNKTVRFATSFIRSICRSQKNKMRLMDIGCGFGFFLKQFKDDSNFELVGIDASKKAVDEASKFISDIVHESIEKVSFDRKTPFDFVVAFEVIEHLTDPVAFLKKVYGFLKDDSYLFITTPDVGSLWFRLLKNRWPGIHPYYHNVYFSKTSLNAMADKCGFKVVNICSKQYYYTNVRHVRKRLLELFPVFGKLFVLLKPADSLTIPFLNGGDLQVILQKKNRVMN